MYHVESCKINTGRKHEPASVGKKTRQSRRAVEAAVLEERNRISGEIHDSLAQHFAGIAMQLAVAAEEMAAGERTALGRVRLAGEMAEVGLAEARRAALSLRPKVLEEVGLVAALRMLVERSNLPGRLRCELRADPIPENHLSPGQQHELLRIAQEAMSNAVRHANPTLIIVALRWERPYLCLQVRDNGNGMAKAPAQQCGGLGLGNMRARVLRIGGKLEIQTAPGRGTRIVVTVPIAS
jgi:signal transduction histidine kinase